jgi:hypothetical protein
MPKNLEVCSVLDEKFHTGETLGDLFDHVRVIHKFSIIHDKSHT